MERSKAAKAAAGATAASHDPIEMEVFSHRLLSITDEMGHALVRSSFSTNIKERNDCSVGIFDRDGLLLAQAAHIPLHLGSLHGGVEAVLREYGPDGVEEGDAFVCNDPYLAGGTHMPDVTVVTPVFMDDALAFFAVNIGHHSDVGGPVPGSCSSTLTSIFSEGLRIPIVKLVRAGTVDRALLGLIAHNTRDPVERELDLTAQLATNQLGARALRRLVARTGLEATRTSIRDLIGYTARRLAGRIAAMADGRHRGTAWIDHDGVGEEPLEIRVAVEIAGATLRLDFTGTSPQAAGAINVPESALKATCLYVVKSVLDPTLPPNEGMFASVSIHAPEGTVLNPRFPAAVGARSSTCQRVARAILVALAESLPAKDAIAPSADMNSGMIIAGPRGDGEGQFVYVESIGGGAGALMDRDGMHAVQVHITNTSNLPAEALELEYPLLVHEYALVPDSAGAGRTRGGAGIAREIEARSPGITVSADCQGTTTPAPGLFGGGTGGTARLSLRRSVRPEGESFDRIVNARLAPGDRIRLETPGGGGIGPPRERAAEAVAEDLREDLITEAFAGRHYGRGPG